MNEFENGRPRKELATLEASYIEVSCGDLNGVLYLEKLRKMAGAKGMNKCILCDGSMLTPSEFELSGGKKANRAWKKSIKHKNKPL